MKKTVVEMWRIHDVLFTNLEDAAKAEDGKESPVKVYVGMDEDFDFDPDGESVESFGSWVYSDLEEAQQEVDEYNTDVLVYQEAGYHFNLFLQNVAIEAPKGRLIKVDLDEILEQKEFEDWCKAFIIADQKR